MPAPRGVLTATAVLSLFRDESAAFFVSKLLPTLDAQFLIIPGLLEPPGMCLSECAKYATDFFGDSLMEMAATLDDCRLAGEGQRTLA